MKYCLVFYNNDLIELIDLAQKENLDDSNLKSFVDFTNQFHSDEELKEYLYYKGYINSFYGKFVLGYYKKNEIKFLPFTISFKNEIKYFNLTFLTSFYVNNATNPQFMKEFINHFVIPLKDTPHVGMVLKAINEDYQNFLTSHILPLEYLHLMESFVIRFVNQKTKEGIIKPNFTKLRELAMFAIEYKRTTMNKVKNNIEADIEYIKHSIKQYQLLLRDENLDDETAQSYVTAIKNLEDNLKEKSLQMERKRK